MQDDGLKEARAYFESGNYSRAKSEYEGLVEEGQESWKNAILRYNTATALLAEGNWQEALLRLQKLSDEDVDLPFLKQRLLSNLAVAHLMQLKARLADLKKNPYVSLEDYYQLSILFRKNFQSIKKADVARCRLEAIEEAISCTNSERELEMQLDVKREFELFLKDFSIYRQAQVKSIAQLKDPVKKNLQDLLLAYVAALIKDPIQEIELKQVEDIQQNLEKILKKSVASDYAKSQKYLNLSVQSLKNLQPEKSRLFLEVARFYI